LCECNLYSQHEDSQYEDINEVLQLREESSGVKISFGLLLAQNWDNCITKSQDKMTKMSEFTFIAATKRKL